VHEKKPDFFPRLLENLFMNIDPVALKEATAWVLKDVTEGLKPLAAEVMPVLLDGLRELYPGEQAS